MQSFSYTVFLSVLKERRITPGEALNHTFVTLSHLVDYAHCNNVKASVQMMEVCRRAGDFTASPAHHQAPPAPQPPPPTSLVANFVPTTNGSAVTLTFNNQLSNQVQRLVREHRTAQTGYDSLVCITLYFVMYVLVYCVPETDNNLVLPISNFFH